jgi:hypothetical protein
MAHFAELDNDNVVLRVLVVSNDQEHRGAEFLSEEMGFGGTWVQCSYNRTIRKNYPGAGYLYDGVRDAFIPPQPFASWSLDEETCRWVAPIARPDDGEFYQWIEPTGWERM